MASVTVCHTQAINISGVVKNSEGSGLEGVKVRLGIAAIMTTTVSDGSFTLRDGTGLKHQPHHTAYGNNCPFQLDDNVLYFNGAEQAEVKMSVYDCNGKLLVSYGKVVPRGNYSMTLPHFGSGVHLYRVTVNNEQYTFKSLAGLASNRAQASSWKAIDHAKQTKATSQIDDALQACK